MLSRSLALIFHHQQQHRRAHSFSNVQQVSSLKNNNIVPHRSVVKDVKVNKLAFQIDIDAGCCHDRLGGCWNNFFFLLSVNNNRRCQRKQKIKIKIIHCRLLRFNFANSHTPLPWAPIPMSNRVSKHFTMNENCKVIRIFAMRRRLAITMTTDNGREMKQGFVKIETSLFSLLWFLYPPTSATAGDFMGFRCKNQFFFTKSINNTRVDTSRKLERAAADTRKKKLQFSSEKKSLEEFFVLRLRLSLTLVCCKKQNKSCVR